MATAIFDGHYLLHRTMHVPHLRMLSTKDKKPTGAMFGFIKSVRATINYLREIDRVVVVFDGGHSKRRKTLFPGYKQRKHEDIIDPDGLSYPQKLQAQIRYLKFILPRLGVKVVIVPGKEGDDVVGLVSKYLDDPLKIIVSDDKDMYQLVSDTVHVWRPMKEVRVTLSNFKEVAGCTKDHFLLRKSILGDSSDAIPGVKGVGEKTFAKIVETIPDIGEYPYENFFEACMDMTGKKILSVVENIDDVLRNYKLVDILLEEFTTEEKKEALAKVTSDASFDVLAVRRLFQSFEFYSLIEDFSQWVTPFQMLR